MHKLKEFLPYILAGWVIIWVFSNWILSPATLGGDFNYISYQHYTVINQRPYIWDPRFNNSFGQVTLYTLPFWYYTHFFNALTYVFHDPFLLHKLIFLWPIVIIGSLSMWVLAREMFTNRWARATAIILYMTNSYFMMITGGGQVGVALAYCLAPLVMASFIKTVHLINDQAPPRVKTKYHLISALLTAIFITLDIRLAFLVLGAVIVLLFANLLFRKGKRAIITDYAILAIIGTIVIGAFHSFWIIPSLAVQSVSLPRGYDSQDSVKFFSFARFAHTFSWMHPNYPANRFGVVKEIVGYSLIFAILAFWGTKSRRRKFLYFALVSLGAAFLAKGTNPPFGEAYQWMFSHVPSFSWFRDSTKFLLLVSIGYSILIGKTIEEFFNRSHAKALLLVAVIGIFISWYPTYTHQLKGTLAYRTIPADYQEIKQVFIKDRNFGRVLWVPNREIYGYYDLKHPEINLSELRDPTSCFPVFCPKQPPQKFDDRKNYSFADRLKEIDDQTVFLNDPYTQELFRDLAINYIVVVADHDREIYIHDQKYNGEIKEYYRKKFDAIPWISKVPTKSAGLIYKTQTPGALFTQSGIGADINLNYTMVNPVKYTVKLHDNQAPLIFNQSYHESWQLKQGKNTVTPYSNKLGMNMYPTSGLTANQEITLEFKGQEYADFGLNISFITIIFTLLGIGMLHMGKKT